MKKRIGILGGISHESTAKYYELIHQKYYEQTGDCYYPEIVIFSLNFQRFTDLENSNQEEYISYINEGIKTLETANVDFIIMAANSPHSVFEKIQKQTPIPMINIAETTAQAAQIKGLEKLLLLGIKHTMQADFYPKICEQYDIKVVTPSDEEQTEIDDLIFKELCVGSFHPKTKQRFVQIINNYEVDGVILGCTELPLLLSQDLCDLPLLNTLELHVEATLRKATNNE